MQQEEWHECIESVVQSLGECSCNTVIHEDTWYDYVQSHEDAIWDRPLQFAHVTCNATAQQPDNAVRDRSSDRFTGAVHKMLSTRLDTRHAQTGGEPNKV